MKQRLEQFLSAENLTKSQFADSINVARAAITHIISGRNNPSYEFIVNTMSAYPNLNIEWLLKGKGKMYKSEQGVSPASFSQSIFDPAPAAEPGQESIFAPVDDETEPEITPRESDEDLNTPVIPTMPASQKGKIRKILVLFDDDTYQEFC